MSLPIKRVLISDSVDESCVKILEQNGIQVTLKTNLTKPQLLLEIQNYDALIVRSSTKVTAEVIQAGLALKVIGRAGTGVDNIDCNAATRQGVLVINAPGGNTLSAAELTCAMIITLSREIPAATASLKEGKWDRKTFMGSELNGKTLAIVGLGRIGREVAHRMQSFGMTTIGFDPLVPGEESKKFGVESLPLEELWSHADYITVHTPLIPQTRNLISKETFKKCKKGVKIINVARGGIVSEADLLEALQSGQCGGAGLDVFEEEPPKNTALIAHPKVVCTPHLGANTKEAQRRVAEEIAEQFVDLVHGKPIPGVVNAAALSHTQNPENKPWAQLSEALGRVAAAIINQLPSTGIKLNLITHGVELQNKGTFLCTAAAVGVLKELGHRQANFINVSLLSKEVGIELNSSSQTESPSISPAVTLVATAGAISHTIFGTVSGFVSLLCSIDGHNFQPCYTLGGNLVIGVGEDSQNALPQVVGSLTTSHVHSCARSSGLNGKAYYLINTGNVVNTKTQPPVSPLKFWTQVSF